jgi:hypothetical protein
VSFGSAHPFDAVVEQNGVFRLRALVVDPAEARAAAERALAENRSWMPEHHHALGKPTGPIHLEAPTLNALRLKLEAFAWPDPW